VRSQFAESSPDLGSQPVTLVWSQRIVRNLRFKRSIVQSSGQLRFVASDLPALTGDKLRSFCWLPALEIRRLRAGYDPTPRAAVVVVNPPLTKAFGQGVASRWSRKKRVGSRRRQTVMVGLVS